MMAGSAPSGRPDVSFAIACHDAMPYLQQAIDTALDQRGVTVEVLVVDDHGTDASLAYARERATRDARIRVFRTPANRGPGGARNVAIENMRGRWYAVLDSDDRIDPDRSARMIAHAERHGADLVADDLVIFGEGIAEHRFLADAGPDLPDRIDLDTYFRNTRLFSEAPNLGFLKPMIRQEILTEGAHRYHPDLRIAEDDELIVRLLLDGADYRFVPEAGYRYRKHGRSISHRLSLAHAERMLASERDIRAVVAARGDSLPGYPARYASVEQAVAFTRAIEALKNRRIAAAVGAIARTPMAARHFAMPIKARIRRWAERNRTG